MSRELKTNAMRILDKAGVDYTPNFYEPDGQIDGIHIATVHNQPFEKCFKTLVTKGKKTYFVFCIPVDKELNLKAAAKSVNEKSVEMIAVKDLLKVTGYIRGGCSPIGMKKQFKTVINSSAKNEDTIFISGGRIGTQIEISPEVLSSVIDAKFENITH